MKEKKKGGMPKPFIILKINSEENFGCFGSKIQFTWLS
jgi:hypothetical protein